MNATSSSPRVYRVLCRLASLAAASMMVCAGCSTYIGTTAKSFLRHARSNPDPNIRYIAYSKLGHPEIYDDPKDRTDAVTTLVTKLDEGREPVAVRAVIIRSLGEIGDARARNAIARVANNPNAEPMLKVEAYRALGKVGTAEDAMMLARIMNTDPLEDSRIAAIEGIGALKAQDPRIFLVLIEGMEHEDPAIRLESYRALKNITGKDVGNTAKEWRRALLPAPEDAEKTQVAETPATDAAGPPAITR